MERLAATRTNLERLSAGLLVVGLLVAIVAADELPRVWSTALFAVLLVLDGITISWLTRPCEERRPSSLATTRLRSTGADGSLSSRCGAAR